MEIKRIILVFIIITVSAAVIVAFGSSMFGKSQSGFGRIQPVDYSLNPAGEFLINIKNTGGEDIILYNIIIKIPAENTSTIIEQFIVLSSQQQSDFLQSESLGEFRNGERYTAEIVIVYNANEINLTTSGIVKGSVENI